jgi:protein-disulfide isomerase
METTQDKKIKNLISAVILLGGLFVGSLFVDLVQVIRGGGFSAKNLNKSEIFEAGGKVWVAYSDPVVGVKVINDDACETCDVSEALVWFRRVLPTISTEKIAYDSQEGKELIEKFGLKTLPALIFDKEVVETEFYAQAQVLFNEKEGAYVLNTQELGMEPGRYVSVPGIKEDDAKSGKLDSEAKVVVFSDFECPYCKTFWETLRSVMEEYGDKAAFAYKHLPLTSIHPQADNAALASACATEQEKFWEYGDKLYSSQSEWSKASGTQRFKDYARTLGLDAAQFNKCLDDKKFQDRINADKEEATNFGIAGTPAIFVNEQFRNGVVSADDLKGLIDSALAE